MDIFGLIKESSIPYTLCAGAQALNVNSDIGKQHLMAWKNQNISDLVYDSRRAAPGTVFVCLTGQLADGHRYAEAAYQAGCRIFLAERSLTLANDALVILTPDTRAALAKLSDAFFGHPQKELTIIGITGTKGKTTVTALTAAALNASGIPTGTIGTIGITYHGNCYPTVNSTPESYVLHQTFRKMADAGIRVVVMEVSSLALCRNRVDGIRFDIAAFTNLSEDHISPIEHPDFDDYKEAKKRLFRMCDYAVIAADSPYTDEFQAACSCPFATYGLTQDAAFRGEAITPWQKNNALGISFLLNEANTGRTNTVTLRLPGAFNAQNALCAIAILKKLGLSDHEILPPLETATVPGRFEILDALDFCTVVLDYAHNEMSMRSLLQTVRAYQPKRIVVLYGSIGGRAQHRRKELALVTGDLADYAVITSDNPDFEEPESIVAEIVSYYNDDMCPHTAIVDRGEAIRYVIDMAEPGDILLFCGKGHETYQIVRGVHVPFSEKQIILQHCSEKKANKLPAAQAIPTPR